MGFHQWSTTAADNDDSDSAINWAEGQTAASVNNSARAMMAVLAVYRDLIGGKVTSGGAANAYTLTTGLSMTAYQQGVLLGMEANHTNTGAATLNVDGIGAKSVKKPDGTALAAGDIVSGGIYQLAYESGADVVFLLNPSITNVKTAALEFVVGNGVSTISTGVAGDLFIPFACTITAARALADQSGSIVVDVWLDTYANFPPTDADSITAAAPITVTAATKSEDTTLTGWTVAVPAGSILRFNVDSVTSHLRVTIVLTVTKT